MIIDLKALIDRIGRLDDVREDIELVRIVEHFARRLHVSLWQVVLKDFFGLL